MGPDGGNSNYASIDVDAYGEAVSDLENTHTGIADHILHLESDFNFFGVSMTNFNKLKEAKNDLDDVVPGLRRRHSLAVQLLAEQQAQGFAGDGVIGFTGDILNDDFASVEEAQQAGEDAAGLIGEDGEIPQEVYEQLEKYGHDPDFAEAFINSLDPDTRALLLIETDNNREEDGGESNFQALSTTFATASFRIDYDAEFIEEMNQAMLDRDLHPAGIRMVDRMAAMMQNDTWSHESVLAFAEAALADDNYDTIGQVDDWAAVINALARNPRASAEYMNAHPEEVWDQSLVVGPVTSTEEWDEAWSRFIQAGTVDARTIYERLALYDDSQENLAAENAAFFINQVGSQKEGEEFPFSENMREVFGNITEEYWDDFMYAFSAPGGVPPWEDGRVPADGIDPKVWDAFITEAMRSDEQMARIMDLIYAEQESTRDDRTDDGHDASGWDGYINGRLGDLFMTNFNQIMEERGASEEERQAAREGMVDFIFGLTDPKSALIGLGTDALKGIINGLMKDLTKEETEQLDTDVFSYHQTWRDYANGLLEDDNIPPYEDENGITWEGDPGFYEELYGNGSKFTDSSGNILPLEEIQADPDALRAYNEWLKDPAVQNATNGYFQDENHNG